MKRFFIHLFVKVANFLEDKLDDFVFWLVTKHLDDIFNGEKF